MSTTRKGKAVTQLRIRLGFLLATGGALVALATTPHAHADPPPFACDGPGLPPCASGGDPGTMCAIIAWRTMTPCNYWGVKVPQGTPGSWG